MDKRLVTAIAVAVVAIAITGGAATFVVEPHKRDVVAVTPDCKRRDEDGQCVGSTVKYGPRRGWTIVISIAGLAGAVAFAIAYRRGRSNKVPEARLR